MSEQYMINPRTNKSIKVGGTTYFNLVKQGVIAKDPSVRHPNELYHIKEDDTLEQIERIKDELRTDTYFAKVGHGPILNDKLLKKSYNFGVKSKNTKEKPVKNTVFFQPKKVEYSESSDSDSSDSSDDHLDQILNKRQDSDSSDSD